ncbi:MAG: thioesterase family protein [Peptococcaceae bacterium]|nr:thioesterase family protein [Peptococcaceae bacterium]
MNSNFAEISPGRTATVRSTVSQSNTAKTVGSGSMDVFATPMMIALMEQAACECLAACLKPEQTSVGTKINVTHTAASPLGEKITATAVIESVDGRRIEFAVSASDSKGEIGRGSHTRVLVNQDEFLERFKATVSAGGG